MSKSYDNAIYLSDPDPVVKKKVGLMFTDPKRIKRTDPGRPEVCNVHSYYAVFFPEKKEQIARDCRSAKIGCTECKADLAELLINLLKPIHEKRKELLDDIKKVENLLKQGAEKASVLASQTVSQIRKATFK